MLDYKVIGREEYRTSKWSGGETSQLKISPESSSLDKRDFDYRISLASLKKEESDFSDFIGYMRYISPLEGDINLSHKGRYNVFLKEYDIDKFNGSWETVSRGKCRDFNLIVDENIDASMSVVEDFLTSQKRLIYFYCFDQDIKIEMEFEDRREVVLLKKRNLLEIKNRDGSRIKITFGGLVGRKVFYIWMEI